MSTFVAKKEQVDRKWYVVDAAGKPLGRLAARIATMIQGKHKPIYTPHVDTGDFIVVINAAQVAVQKKKLTSKIYYRYSGYPGGLKKESLGDRLNRKPEMVLRSAVHGMIPKTKLGKQMLTKLKIYTGSEHPHEAQQPEILELAL